MKIESISLTQPDLNQIEIKSLNPELAMKSEIELASVNRKHEKNRQKSSSREKQLSISIMEHGIEEPLLGVRTNSDEIILLDGFKRLRCALKLGIGFAPFRSLGENETVAILQILKISNAKTLTMMEQAAFVEELKAEHGLSVAEIATRLQRSKAWVNTRITARSEMSEATAKAILSGGFPFYSYFYTLHPYMRVAGVASKKDIDEFISFTAHHGLSTRDIDLLSNAYFRGGESIREQIKSGNLSWCLEELKTKRQASFASSSDLSDVEKKVLRDLDIFQGCMGRLSLKLPSLTHGKLNQSFQVQADLLVSGTLSRIENFTTTLRGFHDQSRKA